MKIYSCEQMRKIEENAFNGGMSYIQMMENAGRKCSERILKTIIGRNRANVCVLCGKGKNGGDGFVIARYLKNAGQGVNIILTEGEPTAPEAVEMKKLSENIFVNDIHSNPDSAIDKLINCDIIVDCIFGAGFKGEMSGLTAELAENINSLGKTVVSVDIPSGLEGDSGKVGKVCIKADCTLAIGCKKPVHVLNPAKKYCGKIYVVDIGFSEECYEKAQYMFLSVDNEYVKSKMIKRTAESNKGTYGKVMCLCGSRKMQGAAVLCSNAAVKSGVGLVVSAFPEKAYCAIAPKLTEPLMLELKDDKNGFISAESEGKILNNLKTCKAVSAGCGLGNTDDVKKIICSVIKNAKCPVVLDADGINVICDNINILKTANVPLILTPHPGEMSRLTGKSVSDIQENRLKTASDFAKDNNVILVLKGNNTVIASPDGRVFVNSTGNAGMAKGGSGDVLTGIIGSFSAQGMEPVDAAVCAVYVHGMAGDEAAKKFSETGITPSMIIDRLPKLFSKFE